MLDLIQGNFKHHEVRERGMRIVEFKLRADALSPARLGAVMPDGSILDLQAAHFSMRSMPSAFLRDDERFHQGGAAAANTTKEVVAWAATQHPPGVFVGPGATRILREIEPSEK